MLMNFKMRLNIWTPQPTGSESLRFRVFEIRAAKIRAAKYASAQYEDANFQRHGMLLCVQGSPIY